ncbi:DNA sulfur modification protein DndC [Vibrio crassostreae]|nr:DNA sulfur modification protein DndC [Vibrio crassostreae]
MTLLVSTAQDALSSQLYALHMEIIDRFNDTVRETRSLIEADEKYICHEGLSMGKDSTLVALCLIEAYKQSIAEGKIEPSRPLMISTVNPGAEALPMQMYSEYAAPFLKAYAKDCGINLFYDGVAPDFHEEYANRYLSAQKVIQNASMSGDCTVILKLIPSEKYIKTMLNRFEGMEGMEQYASSPVISFSGSRVKDESTRRTRNMKKQGTAHKTIDALKAELVDPSDVSKFQLYQYAPIRDWLTDEVFTALELAGKKPLTKNLPGIQNAIPAFMSDFALLLAIYGNAAQEACEISVGQKHGAGCSGKARYGCLICTQVGTIDKTQTSLAKQDRWNILGQEEALRLRDYMFRLSANMRARALHAKGYDSVGYGRIALQPNVLKPRYLEKLVRLFAQLSILSQQRAAEFRQLVAEGKEHTHPGIIEIQNDVTLNAKARRGYLAMYKAQAVKAQINLFSERHAVYLSYRWGIDGIASLPFRPLAIWRDLHLRPESWVPFPKTNAEWEAETGKVIKLVDPEYPLPEAVMMPVFKNEEPKHYVANHRSLLSYWRRPIDTSDITNETGFNNCTLELKPEHSTTVKVEMSVSHSFKDTQTTDDSYKLDANIKGAAQLLSIGEVTFGKPVMGKVRIDGKLVSKFFESEYLSTAFTELATNRINNVMEAISDKLVHREFVSLQTAQQFVSKALATEFPSKKPTLLTQAIPYLKSAVLGVAYNEKPRKVSAKAHFTKRVVRTQNGKLTKSNTRVKFYPLSVDSRLHLAHANKLNGLNVDFGYAYEKEVSVQTELINCHGELVDGAKIAVTEQSIEMFKRLGGFEKTLEIHDSHLNRALRHREPVRKFISTCPAEMLNSMGGVVVSPSYIAKYRELLKRTQLFAEIGALDYQSMSVEEIQKQSWAVPMKQHRVDKVGVLRVVRELRNKQRKQVKAALHAGTPHQESLLQVQQLFNLAQQYVEEGFDTLSTSIFNVQFNTHEVSHSQRAAAYKAWLLLNQDALSSFDELQRMALTPSQRSHLALDASFLTRLATVTEKAMSDLSTTATAAIQKWSPMVQAVQSIREQIELAEKSGQDEAQIRDHQLRLYKLAIEQYHPQTAGALFEPSASHLRPNLTNFKLMLDKQLERMSKAIEWFTDLAKGISAEGSTLKSKAVAKVDLSTRLSYCANLPNTSQKVPVPASLELPVIVHEDLILESKSESKQKTKKTAKRTNTLESMLAYQAKQEDFEHV